MNATDGLVAHALDLATRGWEVFPLAGKRPATPHGFRDATTDPATVAAWWRRWPGANIGGRIPAALVMLDTDPRHAGGRDPLADLAEPHGGLPATLTSASGRGDGGLHRWYRHPGGTVSGARLPAGVDLQHHDLRYAVLPPSLHPATGRPYRWVHTSPPAPLPRCLAVLLRPAAAPVPRPRRWPPPGRGTGRLDALCRHVAAQPEGNRNAALYWAARRAGELVAGGLDPADVAAELAAAAERAGLDRREAEATLASALRAEGVAA